MYFLSIVLFIIVLCLTCFISGGTLLAFVDWPSLILVLLMTVSILAGSGVIKDINRAFKMVLTRKWDVTLNELKRAEHGITTLMKTLRVTGLLLTVISFIQAFSWRQDIEDMLMCSAVALLPAFYALLLYMLMIPIDTKIKKCMINFMG